MTHEATIRDIEAQRCALINAGDIDGAAVLHATDYQHVHGTGAVTDLDATMGRFRAQHRTIERGELTVRVWGEAAVLMGEQHNRLARPDGTEAIMSGVVTQVLRLEVGTWRFASFQMTLLPA